MDYLYEIALSLVPHIGPIRSKLLIRHCGSAKEVFKTKTSSVLKIPDIGLKAANELRQNKEALLRAEKELEFIAKHGIEVLYYENKDFPSRLVHCPDHPIVLFKKGNANLNESYVLSIVGTRKATPYGKRITEELVDSLQGLPVLIASGLAYGIDITAHRAALTNKLNTVGVVAHGLDQLYPRDHTSTAKEMLKNGALLTEFISDSRPDKENFPKRNRIVAGIADATIVVESQDKGGALITGKLAADYNRDVFAVPGKVGDPFSEGCNHLIQKNLAAIYTGPHQLIETMGWKSETPNPPKNVVQLGMFNQLEEEELDIVELLKESDSLRRDELSNLLNKPVSSLSATLLNLELKGIVRSASGGSYSLIF